VTSSAIMGLIYFKLARLYSTKADLRSVGLSPTASFKMLTKKHVSKRCRKEKKNP